MTTYNTGNPIGSTDPKDLYDNAQNLDVLVNSATEVSHADRKGVQRKTWRGIEDQFDQAQSDRADEFAQFMADSAYQELGDYADGIVITRYNQVFRKDGEWYRPASALDLPYTTTGVWGDEAIDFVGVGDAVLRQDLAAPGGATLVGFQQAGTGAVATTMEDKARQSVSVWDFLTTEQKADVASGAGTIDVLPALNAAIASAVQPGTFVYPVSGIVELPRGTLFLNGTLTLTSSVHLIGHGMGQQGGNWATTLKFPANVTGIVTVKANTGPNQNGADGSIIEGVYIKGGGGTLGSAHGVDMQARIKLRDVVSKGFSGNGINIVADIAARKNSNCWVIDTATLIGNGMHGLYVQGGDANAGYATGIDASSNGGWGIWDNSFLGNTYVGCHTDGNGKNSKVHYGGNRYYCANEALAGSTTPGTGGSVWVLVGSGGSSFYYPDWVSGGTYLVGGAYASTGANARNAFIGCYSESGSQPPCKIVSPAVVLGGLQAAGFDSATTGLILGTDGDNISRATFTQASGSSRVFSVKMGASATPDNAISLLASGDHPSGVQFAKWAEFNKTWGTWWAGATPITYTTTSLSTETGGRASALGGGKMLFPTGYWLGSGGANYRNHTTGSAAPTTGEWARGDIVFNVSPSAGGFVGWVCTAAGTPGTWKTFGAISA